MTIHPKILGLVSLIGMLVFSVIPIAWATDLTSTNFIIRDSVMDNSGGFSSSSSFMHFGSDGQNAIGESSGTNFTARSGFLYFSAATSGTGSVLTQNTYRWYQDSSALQPTTALESENMPIVNVRKTDFLRLRLAIKATGEPFPSNKTFKLQYAAQGTAASCAAINNNNFIDVGAPGDPNEWITFDGGATDGAQISANLLSTAANGSRQTYEEANPTAGTPSVIFVGSNAASEWDWVLRYQGVENGKTFCFRQLMNDNTLLDTYSVYPAASAITSSGASSTTSSGGGGGGGSGGSSGSGSGSNGSSDAEKEETAKVTFKGTSYPSSTVTLLKDGTAFKTTKADEKGKFSLAASLLTPGKYTFALYTADPDGLQSNQLTKVLKLKEGATNVVNLVLPPTLFLNKTEVKRGDALVISGYAVANKTVSLIVSQVTETGDVVVSEVESEVAEDGRYSYTLNTDSLAVGQYSVLASSGNGSKSTPSEFSVGEKTVLTETKILKGDLNADALVNLIDFSILAFWYEKALPTELQGRLDFDGDRKVTLTDFSILITDWTG